MFTVYILICEPVWNPKKYWCFKRSLRKTLSSHNHKQPREERQKKLAVGRAKAGGDRRKGGCEVNLHRCESNTFTVAEVTERFAGNPQLIHMISYCKAFVGHLENTKCWVLLFWLVPVVWSSTELDGESAERKSCVLYRKTKDPRVQYWLAWCSQAISQKRLKNIKFVSGKI